jgi:hypothetical protein
MLGNDIMTSVLGFHSNFDQEVESPAIYRPPPRTAIVSRETVKYAPEGKASYGPGDTIRIKVDADGFLDGLMSYLSMTATITGGTAPRFLTDIQCLFNRVRILDSNQNVLEDIADYNLLHRMLLEATMSTDYKTTAASILQGVAPTDLVGDAAAVAWAAGRQYNVLLLSGVINGGLTSKFYPTAHNGLIIEIDLEQASTCIWDTAAGSPTYTVTGVNYVADIVKFDPEYEATFNSRWVNEGVVYPYDTYSSFFQNLNGSGDRVRVSENLSSLKSVYAGARATADITDVTTDSMATLHDPVNGQGAAITQVNADGLQDYQFKHLNNYFPKQVVVASGSGAEAFSELQKSLGQHQNLLSSGSMTSTSYVPQGAAGQGEKFIIGQEFERSATHVSGLRSKNGPLDLILRYGSSQTGASINVYTHFDRLAILSVRGISLED